MTNSALVIPVMLVILSAILLPGCSRERPSEKPPIHLNPNMDNQPKYKAQAESDFFADGATMRTPVEGTVARGYLREDHEYFRAMDKDGNFIQTAPVSITTKLLKRGQERFDIYCSPCHSRLGDGTGVIIARGYVPPPTFHSERLRGIPDGEIFDVITNGIGTMPAYYHQIPVDDRWAITVYMRALQRSQNADVNDIPADTMENIR